MRPRSTLATLTASIIAVLAVAQQTPTEDPSGEQTTNPADNTDPKPENILPRDRREIVVRLRDGRFLSGVLVEEADTSVTLSIAGIETTIPLRRIDRYEILPPIEVRYEQWREALDPNDIEGRLLLVDWLRTRGLISEALDELDLITDRAPGNREAATLRREVEAQRALIERRRQREARRAAPVRAAERPAQPQDTTVLTDEQINTLRVFELGLDEPVRYDIADGVLEDLRKRAPQHPSVLALPERIRDNPARVLRAIFDLRARDLYDDITVRDDPETIRRFTNDVHGSWLLNSCATNRCHGGAEAGRLQLAPRGSDRAAIAATNFLLLHRAKTADGSEMINVVEPEASPFLQAALPRNEATTPHPEAPGWRPAIPSKNHPRFQNALAWIDALARPRPDYPIDFKLVPKVRPTAPAQTVPAQPNQSQNDNPSP